MSHLESLYLKFRERCLAQDPATHNSGWEDVLVPYGMARAGRVLGDKALLDWSAAWFERQHAAGVHESSEAPYLGSKDPRAGFYIGDYCGNWGGPLVCAELHRAKPEARHVETARAISDALLRQATRLKEADGAFAHGGWEYGRKSLWVDTLFYSSSVLAETYALTGEKRYAEEAIKQALLHTQWLQDPTTGGYFHDVVPATRLRTPDLWARGNGWIILALVDTLRLCPREMAGWSELLAAYRMQVTCLLRLQHASGIWRMVPEHPDAHLESSGSAMILAGIAAGVAEGWMEECYRIPVLRGYNELLTWIDRNGCLQGAQRPAGMGGWDVHKLSTMGECTYANGLLWRLFAELTSAGLIKLPVPATK